MIGVAFRECGNSGINTNLICSCFCKEGSTANFWISRGASNQQPCIHSSPGRARQFQKHAVDSDLDIVVQVMVNDKDTAQTVIDGTTDQTKESMIVVAVRNRIDSNIPEGGAKQLHRSILCRSFARSL